MSSALTPYRVEALAWFAVISGLIAGIGVEADWGRRLSWPLTEISKPLVTFVKPELTETFRLPPPDEFIEIALRPAFVVTRRPAPIPPPPEAPKPKMKKDQFNLTGTTIIADEKFAHLIEKANKKSHVVAQGKEINGLLIQEITPDHVVLTQYDDIEHLVLRTAKAPLPPAAGKQDAALPGSEAVAATQKGGASPSRRLPIGWPTPATAEGDPAKAAVPNKTQ